MARNGRSDAERLERLRAEVEEGITDDPRMLLHPTFLAALHAELGERLGGACARGVLLRAGYFHGVRDALRVVRGGGRPGAARSNGAPLVAVHLDPGRDPGSLTVRGHWPDGLEAQALLARGLGAPRPPACLLTCGYTSGWLSGLWDAEIVAVETACRVHGAERCSFEARESERWREAGDARITALCDALPHDALWSLAAARADSEARAAARHGMDAGQPVVHVWGPVMVVPYAGPETAGAIEALSREKAGRRVCVVVVDLAGAVVDEGFGALELERALGAVERLGAEAILTGVSPLSEAAVADLAGAHLVVRKELPEAVAVAFQVAWARSRPA